MHRCRRTARIPMRMRKKPKGSKKTGQTKQHTHIIWSDKIKAFAELYNLFNCFYGFRPESAGRDGEDHLNKIATRLGTLGHLIKIASMKRAIWVCTKSENDKHPTIDRVEKLNRF